MIKFCFTAIFISIFFACNGQGDTTLVKSQKGFLFISSYNGKYDYNGGHWRPVGFHDYFFPCNSLSPRFLFDSTIAVVFKNGMRVNSMRERYYLKKKAIKFKCLDSSECYPYKDFYLISVTITYKIYEDNWPLTCGKNSFELTIEDRNQVKFGYNHKAIEVLKYSFN